LIKRYPAKQIGRIGELFIGWVLEQEGYHTTICDADGFDLIVWKNNIVKRVQVKSTSVVNQNSAGKFFSFSLGLGASKAHPNATYYDILALVAIPAVKINFFPVGIYNRKTVKIKLTNLYEPEVAIKHFNKIYKRR
tara:strand:+ start:2413 stop:2820 length:408 start_codon:yes stop_codon:yes gene_type:complete